MTINLLPGKDCAVVAEEKHTARKVHKQRNDWREASLKVRFQWRL
jgi:hypothetical protein